MTTVGCYPTHEERVRRWEELAREIAAAGHHLPENARSADAAPKGTLIVLGSGIEGVGFTMDSEPYLRMADKVFYCVSNRPTEVWLQSWRPDAYDLHVLYDDAKPRYHTYVQMSEAILHYVRLGLRVVTVYYGHPGIFVFSTHRSIEIARREGHYAVMKPGISALDCLCADLGVDPSYPGMQMFEATDALLRNRKLDTTAHVVLWQVGLIGNAGYRRKGYVNDRFPLLVEYLEQLYGPDHSVTHYVASRVPTFEPTIGLHKIGRLLEPRVRATFHALSTFYIPPKDAGPVDADMAARLGMASAGRKLNDLPPVRQMASYAQRELEALQEFEHWRVPADYEFQQRTRAAEFLIELGQNTDLQDLYRRDPARAVSEESFPGLSSAERQLLVMRDQELAQMAARGSLTKYSPAEQFVIDIHKRRELASGLRSALASLHTTAVDEWISSQGYQTTMARLSEANKLVNASMLLPWTGVYASQDASVVVTIVGSPDSIRTSVVYVNDSPIADFTFHDGTLLWPAGELTFRMPKMNGTSAFVRTASGKYGAEDLLLSEVVPHSQEPAGSRRSFEGRYRAYLWSDGHWKRQDFDCDGRLEDGVLQWSGDAGNGHLRFFIDPITQSPKFAGSVWSSGECPEEANYLGVHLEHGVPDGSDGLVPARVRDTLAAIEKEARDPSYQLLWSRWQRSRFTCRLLNHLVPRVWEMVGGNPGP